MSRAEFATFLDASLGVLRRETPEAARRLAVALGGRVVRFDVEPASFVLRMTEEGHRLEPAGGDCAVSLGLDREIVIDLVEGRLSLPQAVLRERLRPCGRPAELGRFFEALVAYLEGAVRAPSMPRLYQAFRAGRRVPVSLEETVDTACSQNLQGDDTDA